MRKINLHLLAIILLLFTATMSFAKDDIIYSITQDSPMGTPNEEIKKNFYLDMGEQHGIKEGSTVDVFRKISRLDPYQSKKRFNYTVKIGELNIIHSEENTSIASLNNLSTKSSPLLFEINNFMIGDTVQVKVNKN